MKQQTPRKVTGGFTLIELLVVIAIIAILAAILFPVFARAREKARAISCISNLKEVCLASLMYTQDYDEMIIPEWLNESPPLNDWDRLWPVTIQPYLKNYQTTVCPDAPQDGGPDWPNDPENHRVGASLGINDLMSDWDTGPVKLAAINAPSFSVHFADAGDAYDMAHNPSNDGGNYDWDGGPQGYLDFDADPDNNANGAKYMQDTEGTWFFNEQRAYWGNSNYPLPCARHMNMCNVAFFDGHAKAIRLSQYWIPRVNKGLFGGPTDHFGQQGIRGAGLGP